MKLDYESYATLNGIAPPPKPYMRGGDIAHGSMAKMVKLGVEHIDKGYIGVMVLFDDGSLDAAKIGEVAARFDFPK